MLEVAPYVETWNRGTHGGAGRLECCTEYTLCGFMCTQLLQEARTYQMFLLRAQRRPLLTPTALPTPICLYQSPKHWTKTFHQFPQTGLLIWSPKLGLVSLGWLSLHYRLYYRHCNRWLITIWCFFPFMCIYKTIDSVKLKLARQSLFSRSLYS